MDDDIKQKDEQELEETLLPETEEDFVPDGHERISKLEEEIKSLQEELDSQKNSTLRALADYQNLKNRFERERQELLAFSKTILLTKILEIADDFSISLKSFSEENKDSWKEGIELLYDKILSIITSQGVALIEVKEGDIFNPEIHEAISYVNTKNEEEDQRIVHVVSLGFKQIENGQVIKTAKVIVNKKN